MHFSTYLILFLSVGAMITAYVSWSHGLLVFPSWTGIPTQPLMPQATTGEGFRVKKGKKPKDKVTIVKGTEKFDNGDAQSDEDAYNSRIYVMQVFEAVLHRKPTNDEIVKYSAYGPSQSKILSAIVDDNPSTQSPDGCDADDKSCALPVMAGSNEEACEDDATSTSSDESYDSEEDDGIPTMEWKIPKTPLDVKLPRPFAPSGRVVYDRPDVVHVMGSPQPCLDRMDVLKRLQAISDDVENFKKYVTML